MLKGYLTTRVTMPSRETKLFLNCIRWYFGDAAARAKLEDAIDDKPAWDHVIELASYHGVIPIVHTALFQTKSRAIPEDVERRVRAAFHVCAVNSLLYEHELARLPFRAKGVRAIAFKGPALAIGLYGKASLRQCRDLDVLVAKSDIPKALSVLSDSGYRMDPSCVGLADALQTEKHLLLIHNETAAKLELHWALSLPRLNFRLCFDTLWDRRETLTVLDTPVATPCPNDLLMMLCVHGASHCWTSLKWVCDIAEFIRRYSDLDWMRLRTEAKQLACWRMVLLGISLAKEAAGAVLPNAVDREIAEDRTVRSLADEAYRRFFTLRPLYPMNSRDSFQKLFTDIRSRERLSDRIRIGGRYLRSVLARDGSEMELIRLPGFLRFFCWPFRILRLIRRSWRNVTPLLTTVIAPEKTICYSFNSHSRRVAEHPRHE
jgi:hypothetical protein